MGRWVATIREDRDST